jgi:hypothetical protein
MPIPIKRKVALSSANADGAETDETVITPIELPWSIHALAELFPLMRVGAYDELKADIEKNGQLERVVLTPDGQLLDGRHRAMALTELGLAIETRIEDAEPLAYVRSANYHRRHLTTRERAIIAAKMANMKSGTRTDLVPNGTRSDDISLAQAAEVMGVGRMTVARVKAELEGKPKKERKKKEKVSEKVTLESLAPLTEEDNEEMLDILAALEAERDGIERDDDETDTESLPTLPQLRSVPTPVLDRIYKARVYDAPRLLVETKEKENGSSAPVYDAPKVEFDAETIATTERSKKELLREANKRARAVAKAVRDGTYIEPDFVPETVSQPDVLCPCGCGKELTSELFARLKDWYVSATTTD